MIVIVDYGMGNLGSIRNMIRKIGGDSVISSDADTIRGASKLILPGVGAFDHGMKNLDERRLLPVLHELVVNRRVPILGICLGMQLLGVASEEGERPGLAWIKGACRRFRFEGPLNEQFKVPHMGWNSLCFKPESRLYYGWEGKARFYFVHSYHMVCAKAEDVSSSATYGIEFTASVERDNIFGVQFHPEKSHKFGMKLFSRFLEL